MIDYGKLEKILLCSLIIDKYTIDINKEDVVEDEIYIEGVMFSKKILIDFVTRWITEYSYLYKNKLSSSEYEELIYCQLTYLSKISYVKLSDYELNLLTFDIAMKIYQEDT